MKPPSARNNKNRREDLPYPTGLNSFNTVSGKGVSCSHHIGSKRAATTPRFHPLWKYVWFHRGKIACQTGSFMLKPNSLNIETPLSTNVNVCGASQAYRTPMRGDTRLKPLWQKRQFPRDVAKVVFSNPLICMPHWLPLCPKGLNLVYWVLNG